MLKIGIQNNLEFKVSTFCFVRLKEIDAIKIQFRSTQIFVRIRAHIIDRNRIFKEI